MYPRRGRRATNPAGIAYSAGGPIDRDEVLERLVETMSMSGPSAEQARRLGATSFHGTTDPTEAMVWLEELEKVLDEGMQCPDEDRVRIAGFLLGGDARKWWVMEKRLRHHTWEEFKAAFEDQFVPIAFKETKRVEFERLV